MGKVDEKVRIEDRVVDLQNIPGKLKNELAKTARGVSAFVAPPNMPGKKLAQLRKEWIEAHPVKKDKKEKNGEKKKNKNSEKKSKNSEVLSVFKVGQHIRYNDTVYEINKVDNEKGVRIPTPDRKKPNLWINFSKFNKIELITSEE